MPPPPPEKVVDLDVAHLEALLRRLESGALEPDDLATLRAVLESYRYVTQLIDHKSTTIARLRKLLFGAPTEKTADVVGREASEPPPNGAPEASPLAAETSPGDDASAAQPDTAQRPPKKGHGRNGADDFPGARRVPVSHPTLKPGDGCPDCQRGTAYALSTPGILLRFMGQAPIQATVYELQKLRCHLCGQVFTAEPPAGVGPEKYDATVSSMVGLLKYGSGVPFNRLDGLQDHLAIPLPASTQWDLVNAAASQLQPAHDALLRHAAQGEVLYNDDTTVKILERMSAHARQATLDTTAETTEPRQRTGLFTSGVVATRDGRRIALFFSGHQHAGENLRDVLQHRADTLSPPIQMCDALSRNRPGELQTILANCLAHARRQFVDVHEQFPTECRYVLEVFETIYATDATTREKGLSSEERLRLHQAESGPPLVQLRDWLKRQVDERLVEPNSGLGKAIDYLRKHWDKLTLFLRVAGAPLDNNLVERALKKAILHRKNAYFYKTQHGASVGDIYMSLIHTCELNAVSPFAYLTALQRHSTAVAADPDRWLPWNFHESLPD